MQPTRRQVLLGAAALTAACTTGSRAPRRMPSPDDRLRAEAVARELALVTAYFEALQAHPALTRELSPVLGDHAAHLFALGGAAVPGPTATVAPRPRTAVLRELVARERQAAVAHALAAESAEADVTCSRTLAPLLASLAACEASHAALLA